MKTLGITGFKEQEKSQIYHHVDFTLKGFNIYEDPSIKLTHLLINKPFQRTLKLLYALSRGMCVHDSVFIFVSFRYLDSHTGLVSAKLGERGMAP